jgi:hypothetical protein
LYIGTTMRNETVPSLLRLADAGAVGPTHTSSMPPVPKVIFVSPGRTQLWPTRLACWSPTSALSIGASGSAVAGAETAAGGQPALLEAQVLLHNHSWNQQRAAQGQQPINSLWFWGGGVMPVSVSTVHAQVRSRDALLQSLAQAAGVAVDGEQAVDALVDLRQLRSLQQLGNEAIRPLLAALKRGELQRLVLDFEDGLQFQLDRGQRWQFWKKPRQLHD